MAYFQLDASKLDELQKAMKDFPLEAERIVNEVLHTDGGKLIEEEIRRLMPVSNVTWKGKKPPAKTGKSLNQENDNLAVTLRTTKDYHYLYFPDDGTTTRNHAGNLGFFLKGATNQQAEIIDRCINRLAENVFNN